VNQLSSLKYGAALISGLTILILSSPCLKQAKELSDLRSLDSRMEIDLSAVSFVTQIEKCTQRNMYIADSQRTKSSHIKQFSLPGRLTHVSIPLKSTSTGKSTVILRTPDITQRLYRLIVTSATQNKSRGHSLGKRATYPSNKLSAVANRFIQSSLCPRQIR
jgi:hypothetical protein